MKSTKSVKPRKSILRKSIASQATPKTPSTTGAGACTNSVHNFGEILLRLHPYGMTLTGDGVRPLLLMKDESGEVTFGVPLNPLEAGVTLSQSSRSMVPVTPHKATELLLQSMNVSISRCVFKAVRLHSLVVELEISNHPKGQQKIELRADEAMSLCLHLGVPIFASRDFISKSRHYVAELSGEAQGFVVNPQILQRNHPYLM